jgi:TatD DNase family protein
MTLTDTHCHLDFYDFDDDRMFVLARAWNSGLERILIPGIDLQSSSSAIEIAEVEPKVFASVGVHPNSANKWESRTIGFLDEMTSHPKVVAIGEIGLDYYRDWASPNLQKRIFIDQLNLAQHVNLPVIIHTRNANLEDRSCISDTLEILSNHNCVGVLHSFSGNITEAERAIGLGFFIGITGPVTYKNAIELHKVVACVPLESLLIETDSPFLTPIPHRGKRNEPAYVQYVAEEISKIHNKSLNEVARITAENAKKLFKWSG